jgi:predicted DCC family thiol-disulfide oxidoreductase YuxK
MDEYPDIVLFDGVCNLCNRAVQFVLKHERKPTLKFASLQSETGRRLLEKHGLAGKHIDSIVYIKGGKAYVKSSGALRLGSHMKGIFRLQVVLLAVPRFIRDAVYDWIARNRYKWFGRQESCMLPSPELKSRFVDL